MITVDHESIAELVAWDPAFLVRTSATGAATAAMENAAERFFRVDEDGTEYPGLDELYSENVDDLYTPNTVFGPETTAEGLVLRADCKGEAMAPMVETMTRVLIDELTRAGVDGEVTVPADVLARVARDRNGFSGPNVT